MGVGVMYLNMTDAKCLCRCQTFFCEKEISHAGYGKGLNKEEAGFAVEGQAA